MIALASPSRFRFRRLVNLARHELEGHSKMGLEHEQMSPDMEWSLGPIPAWAKRFDRPGWPRYEGRAPDQVPLASGRTSTIFRATRG